MVNRIHFLDSSCRVEFLSGWAENAKDPNGQTTSPATEIVGGEWHLLPAAAPRLGLPGRRCTETHDLLATGRAYGRRNHRRDLNAA